MRVYYRGPYNSFDYPVDTSDPQNPQYITFPKEPDPDPASTTAGQDVSLEQAAELLTRPGHTFRPVNPVDQAQLANVETPVSARVAARRARRAAETAAAPVAAPATPAAASITAASLPGSLTPNSPAVPKPTAPSNPE